jgi:transposase
VGKSRKQELLSGYRWAAECFFAWLNVFRRITQRFERYAFRYEALLELACAWFGSGDFCNECWLSV